MTLIPTSLMAYPLKRLKAFPDLNSDQLLNCTVHLQDKLGIEVAQTNICLAGQEKYTREIAWDFYPSKGVDWWVIKQNDKVIYRGHRNQLFAGRQSNSMCTWVYRYRVTTCTPQTDDPDYVSGHYIYYGHSYNTIRRNINQPFRFHHN